MSENNNTASRKSEINFVSFYYFADFFFFFYFADLITFHDHSLKYKLSFLEQQYCIKTTKTLRGNNVA